MKLTLSFLFSFFVFALHAQVNVFALLTTADSLRSNAHSILQYEQTNLVVEDDAHAVLKVKQIITVFDKQGDNALRFAESSSSFHKLDEVTITTYSKLGFPDKIYHKKDLLQHAEWGSFVSEGMYYYASFESEVFPATIQFEYTIRIKGIVNYPNFQMQYPAMAIRHAEHIITVPATFDLRYKNLKTSIIPERTKTAKTITYKWVADNVPAASTEENIGSGSGKYASVLIAPNRIKLDDFASDFKNWNDFAKWTANINKGMDNLKPEQQEEIKALIANAKTPTEKARMLYQYLQNNFRYISIQLGIGGFKSFPAMQTHETKYGDCKALSTYMKACLAAAGIPSYTALINSGDNDAPVLDDFAVDEFDHMILCIPFGNDTTWLDCTSINNEFGVLGTFTENRKALVVTNDGGYLSATPATNYHDNRLDAKSYVTINEDGSGAVKSTLYTKGEYRTGYFYALYGKQGDDQKDIILRQLELPAPETFQLNLPDSKNAPTLRAEVNASFEKVIAFKAGNKMFLPASWQKVFTQHIHESKNKRQLDYYFPFAFENNDTTVYKLPDGYAVESLPEASSFSFKYGYYTNRLEYDKAKNEISSYSYIRLTQAQIPAEDFDNMKDFFFKAVGNEVNKIIIKQQ